MADKRSMLNTLVNRPGRQITHQATKPCRIYRRKGRATWRVKFCRLRSSSVVHHGRCATIANERDYHASVHPTTESVMAPVHLCIVTMLGHNHQPCKHPLCYYARFYSLTYNIRSLNIFLFCYGCAEVSPLEVISASCPIEHRIQ